MLILQNGAFRGAWGGGRLVTTADIRATIYYDYNDTSYYVNPRSDSRMSGLRLDGIDNEASGTDAILWINKPNNNDWAMIVTGNLEFGIDMRMAGSHSYAYRALRAGTEYYRVGSDMVFHDNQIRTPTFYISNDTTYLWNNNRIVVNQVTFPYREWDFSWGAHGNGSGTQSMTFRMWDNYTQSGAPSSYGTLIEYYGLSGHQHDQFYFYQGEILHRYGWYGTTNWQSGWRAMLHAGNYSGYSNFSGAVYGTIYYDANNTAFFADPNSRSRLSSLDYGSSGYFFAGGDWGWRHNTPFGWIQFGPANSSHAHIYTSLSNFYFNAQLQVNGGSL
jgi:hypothetical protein